MTHLNRFIGVPKNENYPQTVCAPIFTTLDETVAYYTEKLLKYTREHLTCRAMAQYILRTINKPDTTSVLYFVGDNYPDYMMILNLIGFKKLFGAQCHEYPNLSYIYTDYKENVQNLLGKGLTFTKLLERSQTYDAKRDETLRTDIQNHRYDIVVYGSVHRGTDYLDLVRMFYKSDEIVYVCGEDIHQCDYIKRNLQNLFLREYPA